MLHFSGEILLEGVDKDEFLAAAAFVVEPAPFELPFVAEIVDRLDAASDEFGGLGNADPGRRALHAKADFAIDRRGDHLDEPLLPYGRRRRPGQVRVWRAVMAAAHKEK